MAAGEESGPRWGGDGADAPSVVLAGVRLMCVWNRCTRPQRRRESPLCPGDQHFWGGALRGWSGRGLAGPGWASAGDGVGDGPTTATVASLHKKSVTITSGLWIVDFVS